MNKSLSDNGLELILKFEDFIKFPYKDPQGYNAIGYGSITWEDGSRIIRKKITISEQRARKLFKRDLKIYEYAVNFIATPLINQNQFDALVSFCYDEGIQNLKRSNLISLVNINKDDPNITREFCKHVWHISTKSHVKKLRRKMEANLYFS